MRVFSSGLCRDTMKKIRKVLAPSIRAASSTLTGIDSKNCFMMNTPAASARSGTIMPEQEYIPGAGAGETGARAGCRSSRS
ncbi:hypothetical protein PV963_42650 [Streptomyces coeruleorubidus]|uniref:hypothetical protein n=1 Tax=Streptomyces coeruleorubidus TaxID=116188 RepID=UPI00237F6BE7|nr:hypothetical protein [Streptomyces coeruleorubidus]WDV56557.1 hypothetical protein PV963_42650 [Streptomyces coeruleorubidus]